MKSVLCRNGKAIICVPAVCNFYFNFMGIIPYWLKGHLRKDKGGSFSTDLDENNSKFYNFATMLLEPIEKIVRPVVGISEFIILTPR